MDAGLSGKLSRADFEPDKKLVSDSWTMAEILNPLVRLSKKSEYKAALLPLVPEYKK